MYLFQRIIARVRGWFSSRRPTFSFEIQTQTLEDLRTLADREQRSPQEIAGQLVEDGLRREVRRQDAIHLWNNLTPREQEITALICLHYTNRQIAARLSISPDTVKSHVSHVLIKFEVPNRNALRQLLLDWDFSEWE